MSQAFSNQNMFWDEQLSIARAVAQQSEPSLAKLHHDILEEIGQRPGLELIEYFLELVEIPEEEKAEYLKYAGFSPAPEEIAVQEPPQSTAMPALLLADTVAQGNSPTVLSFRHAYTAEHGEAPSSTLIEYFLKKVQHVQQRKNSGGQGDNGGGSSEEDKRKFAEETANGSHPTVLRLRKGYGARFGGVPSDELIRYFLETLRSKRGVVSLDPSEKVEGISDSKVTFAKSAATRNITTILQFGKVYEKLYGEPPAIELIDVFIKNLPKASDETLFESTASL